MKQTLEVRWFYNGAPPQAVVDWFMALDPRKESAREDAYLVSDDPTLNVKLREGKLQLKRRTAARTLLSFCDGVTGYCGPWQKWSFRLAGDAPDRSLDDPSGLWRPVTKQRYQRKYAPSEQRALLGTLDEPDPATAIAEFTRVRSGSHEAWTICVEAEGRAEALPGTLCQMGRYVFGQGRPPALDERHSYGYARWVKRIYRQEAEHAGRRSAP